MIYFPDWENTDLKCHGGRIGAPVQTQEKAIVTIQDIIFVDIGDVRPL